MGKRHANELLILAKEVFPVDPWDYSHVVFHLHNIGKLSQRDISHWMNANGVAMGQNVIFQILQSKRKSEELQEIESAKILGNRVLENRETNFGGLTAEELMKG